MILYLPYMDFHTHSLSFFFAISEDEIIYFFHFYSLLPFFKWCWWGFLLFTSQSLSHSLSHLLAKCIIHYTFSDRNEFCNMLNVESYEFSSFSHTPGHRSCLINSTGVLCLFSSNNSTSIQV
jgi:hypothetical protein